MAIDNLQRTGLPVTVTEAAAALRAGETDQRRAHLGHDRPGRRSRSGDGHLCDPVRRLRHGPGPTGRRGLRRRDRQGALPRHPDRDQGHPGDGRGPDHGEQPDPRSGMGRRKGRPGGGPPQGGRGGHHGQAHHVGIRHRVAGLVQALRHSEEPWNLDRSPGGSSAGTGNGIAAGLVMAGIGTDTGGSIRIPAAWNGVTGLMPTFGRVPKSGCVPLGYSLDHIGPLARSARDCAAMLTVIAGLPPERRVVRRPPGRRLRGRADRGPPRDEDRHRAHQPFPRAVRPCAPWVFRRCRRHPGRPGRRHRGGDPSPLRRGHDRPLGDDGR